MSPWAERPETKAQMAYDCAFIYFLAVWSALWVKPLDVWPRLQEKTFLLEKALGGGQLRPMPVLGTEKQWDFWSMGILL